MLQRPKRIISNFSFDMLQQAKDNSINSILQYKEKFQFQPNLKGRKLSQKNQSSHVQNQHSQSVKLISRNHTYTVQTNKYVTDKINQETSCSNEKITESVKRKRPNTGHQLKRTKSTFEPQPKDIKSLFQNQQLSASLQSSQTFQKYSTRTAVRNNKKFRSITSACSLMNPNMCVIKVGFNETTQDISNLLNEQTPKNRSQKCIKSTLSSKQNFYNPHNITPSNSYIKPIKHLRSKSIEQLKQLCRQQKNLNFVSKIKQRSLQKQNNSKCIIKNKGKFFHSNSQNDNKAKFDFQNKILESFKKPQKSRIKKANPTWFTSKNNIKSFGKKINPESFLVTQINT